MVSKDGISMEEDKVKAIVNWPELTSVPAVRSFLGITGWYRRFVQHYSKIAAPLTDLLHEDKKFNGQRKRRKHSIN